MGKKLSFILVLLTISLQSFCWGFYAHKKINYLSSFLLPPEMMVLYKPNIDWLSEHAVDPDKRRYIIAEEGPRHYIDVDRYGKYPYPDLPRKWEDAVVKFSVDSLMAHGIVPWHIQNMLKRLTAAFREKDLVKILKNSAELGHYISDAHVPLHASSNHNGQYTGQKGIHGFWESRVPELLAEKEFDFFIGKCIYIEDPGKFIWARIMESAQQADSVLSLERKLTASFPADKKYAFEIRNNQTIRQYSSEYTKAFNKTLDGMVERRMRQSIFAIASFWYTAWVNAGQPDLKPLANKKFTELEMNLIEPLNYNWKNPGKQREHDGEGL